jgi:predicted transcriptional regulator
LLKDTKSIQKIILKGNKMAETRATVIRLREEVHAAMDVLKDRTRISKSVQAEEAIREYLEKRGINVEKPKAD